VVLVAVATVAISLYLLPEPPTVTFVPGAPSPSVAPCPLQPAGQAQCVTTAACFDVVNVQRGVATSRSLDCGQPHLWEAFAEARLPDAVSADNHAAVKRNPDVARVCSQANVGRLTTERNWQIEVLPPSKDQVQAGDRTYRCLAGRPPTRLTNSRFVH
jgi:hypothetical protein